MKKMLLLVLLFLCGCSNKLTCSYEVGYQDIEIKNKIVFDFDNKTLKQIDKMIFENSISASNYFSEIEEYKEIYNLELEGNVIISEIKDNIKLDGDRSKIKERYESYDYKCK